MWNAVISGGTDYVPREVQLTFLPGDFERRLTVPLINDRTREDRELFFVSVHSPVSSLRVELPRTTSSVYITDDDLSKAG